MRWQGQEIGSSDENALPGLETRAGFVRSVTTPEFAGVTFHEVLARSALNRVPTASKMPFDWTVNPYRGCSHACVYCYARGTHEYLDLNGGSDFDTQVVVKTNVAEVLRRELASPSWRRECVQLGSNTDPYQRAEGRYRLMPGIITALAESGTPISVLTKGTLLRRDLPLLADAARHVPIEVAMSIAIFDDDLQQSIEPGTPTTAARLATVRAAADLGLRPRVFLMPIMPHLTDSIEQLDHALARIADAGAAGVIWGPLHLRGPAKPWFLQWLEREHPHLVPAYRGLFPGTAAYAPKGYRTMLGERTRPLLAKHRLRAQVDPDAGLASRAAGTAPARDGGPARPAGQVRRTGPARPAPAMLF